MLYNILVWKYLTNQPMQNLLYNIRYLRNTDTRYLIILKTIWYHEWYEPNTDIMTAMHQTLVAVLLVYLGMHLQSQF